MIIQIIILYANQVRRIYNVLYPDQASSLRSLFPDWMNLSELPDRYLSPMISLSNRLNVTFSSTQFLLLHFPTLELASPYVLSR